MMTDRVLLGTPAVGAAVFAAASAVGVGVWTNAVWACTAGSVGALVGWAAGHGALQGLANPEARANRRYEAEMARKPPQQNTFVLSTDQTGFTPRFTTELPIEDWQNMARVVMGLRPKNFNHAVVRKAFPGPRYSQEQQRDKYAEFVSRLSPKHVGVLVQTGNAYEIVGWGFFARVSEGSLSPFHRYNIPHSPRSADVSQNNVPQRTHTSHTSAIYGAEGEWRLV